MKFNLLLRGAVLTLMLVEMIAVPAVHAQVAGAIERFQGTTANISGAGQPVRIDILRWSTDAQGGQLVTALAKSENDFKTALAALPTQGYVWTSESAGYVVKYAFRAANPDGSERIVIATDRRLGSWDPSVWKPAANGAATNYEFTVLELRIDARKVGEGKASVSTRIAADAAAKIVALENYAAAPVVLRDVKRTTSTTSSD
jgi:hypothetical protein